MTDQNILNINQLKQFAPNSPILAFRPSDSGSPQQDWCRHLAAYPRYRRELEEFAIMGETVLRIVDGIEPAPADKVKILSLEYALQVLKDETDAQEFVRSIKAICSPDAGAFELEQIAAFYYGEIRRREASEVFKEMGLLGIEMQAVTATLESREIDFIETEIPTPKLSVADQRRIRAAKKNRRPLPAQTPNFDEELSFITLHARSTKTTRKAIDDYADYYLGDGDKSLEELDADFLAYEKLQQYDENGIVGFSMSDGQKVEVVYEFDAEINASYLPLYAQPLAREINLIFVGHRIGGAGAQKARQFLFAEHVFGSKMAVMKQGFPAIASDIPLVSTFSPLPFSEEEFTEWLGAKLDHLYPHRTLRTVRRFITTKAGKLVEYQGTQEVNPDFEEMQYVAGICRALWINAQADFHLRSLRRESYQTMHLDIRQTKDTADVARLKKEAYDAYKEHKKLSLKEFTALNTAAKSQEARLAGTFSGITRKTLADIQTATINRLRYLKFFLYNDPGIQALTRQEKQRLWEAVRLRETALQTPLLVIAEPVRPEVKKQSMQRPLNLPKQVVRVTPRSN